MAKDMLNQEIEVGQTVAYPTQTKRGMRLSSAVVTGIISNDAIKLTKTRDDGTIYRWVFHHLNRAVVTKGF